jgi:hypothetical protein
LGVETGSRAVRGIATIDSAADCQDPSDTGGNRKWHTLEFLIQLSTRSHAQGAYKLFEIDSAVLVTVKDIKDIGSKLIRVAKGEELLVDLAELDFVQLATWAVP